MSKMKEEINMSKMKEEIVELVNDFGPIKATELVVRLIEKQGFTQNSLITDILNELVKNGDIIEVSYILPSMTYREKVLYFPKGTIIGVDLK